MDNENTSKKIKTAIATVVIYFGLIFLSIENAGSRNSASDALFLLIFSIFLVPIVQLFIAHLLKEIDYEGYARGIKAGVIIETILVVCGVILRLLSIS
ncbi:MAG: hypothetical protein IT236_07520 [Bacteroidia bacterium]|nr:hypothetical protein [Bacteroidia bacterium]